MKKFLIVCSFLVLPLLALAQYRYDKIYVQDTSEREIENKGEVNFIVKDNLKLVQFTLDDTDYQIMMVLDSMLGIRQNKDENVLFFSAHEEISGEYAVLSFLRLDNRLKSVGLNTGLVLMIFVIKETPNLKTDNDKSKKIEISKNTN